MHAKSRFVDVELFRFSFLIVISNAWFCIEVLVAY